MRRRRAATPAGRGGEAVGRRRETRAAARARGPRAPARAPRGAPRPEAAEPAADRLGGGAAHMRLRHQQSHTARSARQRDIGHEGLCR